MARPFSQTEPRLITLAPQSPRGEVLFLHGAWRGPEHLRPLAMAASSAGWRAHILELPGHGEQKWRLPATTSLKDYACLARRAAGSLGRPVLVGHSLGAWLALKILEQADLPALLLAPLPAGGAPLAGLVHFLGRNPGAALTACTGRPTAAPGPAADACAEPARVCLEMALGLSRARPRPGRQPRRILAGQRDRLLPLSSLERLTGRLGAGLEMAPDLGHDLMLGEGAAETGRRLLEFLQTCPTRAEGEKP